MTRLLAKSPWILFALGLWFLASSASLAKSDDQNALNQQVRQLIAQGKYREAIPYAEKAVELAKRVYGPGNFGTVQSLNNLAMLYQDMGEYAEAKPLYQETLRLCQEFLGKEHLDTATSLSNLATLYQDMGAYAEAEPLYQEALRIQQKVLGKEHLDTARSLSNLGVLYWAMGKYAKAEPLYQEALRIYRKLQGEQHLDTALSLNNLGLLYHDTGQYAKALPLLQEALRIRQKALGPEHPDTAQSLDSLAGLYQKMGEYDKAESLYQEALRIDRKALGPEHPSTQQNLNNLAVLYGIMGEYEKAEPLDQEVLQIRQKVLGKEHPYTALSLNNLAVLYEKMGQLEKAEPLYQEALRIRQKVLGKEHPETVDDLYNLGGLYQQTGEYAKAESLFQDALRIRQRALGPEHPDTAQTLGSLAALYWEMGEYDKAKSLDQEVLRIRRKVLGPEHPDTAQSLNDLAGTYWAMGEYAKAEPLFQESLRIYEKVLGPEHLDATYTLFNLGALYHVIGEYAKAEPLEQEALRIRQKVLGPEHPDTALSLFNLGSLYQSMGTYDKAEPLEQEALRIRRKILGPQHPYVVASLDNLAYCEFDLGRIDEATSLARQESAAELTILSKIFSFTTEQQRLAYLDIFHPYSLFPFLRGTETDLAVAILRYKGVVLDSIVEDRLLAEASHGSEDQKLVEQLNANRRQLGQLLLRPTPKLSAGTNQRIEALEGEVDKIESQLAQRVGGLGQTRHALGVSLEQVQSTIPDDGVLIEYLRYLDYLGQEKWEPRYGAMVLLAKGAPLWIPLGNANEIEHLVQKYGTLVRGSPEVDELSANLRALEELLWAPIGQALPIRTKRIIISPDGELNFISFATLLSKDQQFLAQTYNVQYVASGRDLLRQVTPSTVKEVVLFANPDFALASTPRLTKVDNRSADLGSVRGSEKMEIEDWSFGSLEGTQKENDELRERFAGWGWAPTDFTTSHATKEALLKVHSPYILHLATHGFFAKEDPTSAKTGRESSPNDLQGVTKSKFFKNPMHRSGLALAGAQTTIEAWKREEVPPVENDGILTAEDVSTLDLQGTWLATLSACDTGSGEARAGEGVMGLRRGFIQAGALNLLMTLWPISDEVTVQIMSDFYEAAHHSGNASEALAEVQRKWLLQLRTEKGLAQAVNLAGPFIMSSQGKP